MFSVCNTATFTLIVFMLQITMKKIHKNLYPDIFAAHNHDKESL